MGDVEGTVCSEGCMRTRDGPTGTTLSTARVGGAFLSSRTRSLVSVADLYRDVKMTVDSARSEDIVMTHVSVSPTGVALFCKGEKA